MPVALKAGAAYFAIVFAAGFALGTARVLAIAPRLGETLAIILELPIMLIVSWYACSTVIRRMAVPQALPERLTMAACAFVLLMAAEAALGIAVFGQTAAGYLSGFAEPGKMLGLAAQLVFAAFPLIVSRPGRA